MEPSELNRRLVASTAWTGIDFGVALISGLLLASIFLRTLGPRAYGVYLLLLLFSTPGLLNLFDLGMGGVLISYAARYRATSPELLPRLWSFALLYYGTIAGFVVVVSALVMLVFRASLERRLEDVGVSLDVVAPVLILQAVSLLGLLVEYMLRGFFDYRPIQFSSIAMQVIRLVGAWYILAKVGDLTLLVWWVAACALGRTLVVSGVLGSRYRSDLRLVRIQWNDVREWLAYSTKLLVRSVAGLVFSFSDRLIIPWFLPISSLAEYDIAARAPNMVRALLSITTSAIEPVSATNVALERRHELRLLYLRGGLIVTTLFVPPFCFLLINMRSFITVWVGAEYVHVSLAGQLFIASFALAVVPAIGDAMLLGMGEAGRTVKVTWMAAALNLGVSLALVRPLGIVGVVIGTVVGSTVSDVWLTRIHWRVLSVRLRDVGLEFARPIGLVFVVSAVLSSLPVVFRTTPRLSAFVVWGGAVALVSYTCVLLFAVDGRERALALTAAMTMLRFRSDTSSVDRVGHPPITDAGGQP